mmetsp:Transcript_97686/g.173091  ORF Transcript_97686/g.173091 Transcript_97686/m.173091 type:complete len:347 (+) Transcript_97686:88-1128(+)
MARASRQPQTISRGNPPRPPQQHTPRRPPLPPASGNARSSSLDARCPSPRSTSRGAARSLTSTSSFLAASSRPSSRGSRRPPSQAGNHPTGLLTERDVTRRDSDESVMPLQLQDLLDSLVASDKDEDMAVPWRSWDQLKSSDQEEDARAEPRGPDAGQSYSLSVGVGSRFSDLIREALRDVGADDEDDEEARVREQVGEVAKYAAECRAGISQLAGIIRTVGGVAAIGTEKQSSDAAAEEDLQTRYLGANGQPSPVIGGMYSREELLILADRLAMSENLPDSCQRRTGLEKHLNTLHVNFLNAYLTKRGVTIPSFRTRDERVKAVIAAWEEHRIALAVGGESEMKK